MAGEATPIKRYAVVTGANRGIGFEICRQLGAKGITVVLTARDEKRGLEALDKLKASGLSDNVIFHQLNVADPFSISALADFIKNEFGKLDILVNNAGVGGVEVDADTFRSAVESAGKPDNVNWRAIMTQTYELTEQCLQINYYGAKRMTEAFIPVLQRSDSPRIVNISASMGKLKYIPSDWARGILNDAENLTEERVDEVLHEFLKDFKEDNLEEKGWPVSATAYTVSKAALNAYTRIIAKKYPDFRVNCVCPGFVKTDMNFHTGVLPVEEGAEAPVRLALLPDDGPSGMFFHRNEIQSFE